VYRKQREKDETYIDVAHLDTLMGAGTEIGSMSLMQGQMPQLHTGKGILSHR
jgi:hypothetical protein